MPTASNFRKDKYKNILRHKTIFQNMRMNVDVFDLEKQSPDLLEKFDIIFLMGGNPFYLIYIMRKTNCKEIFSKYIDTKIVVGASAGSLVFGNTMEFIFNIEPRLNDGVRLRDFSGLCLTDTHIVPHASQWMQFHGDCAEKLAQFERHHRIRLHRVDDGQGIVLEKGGFQFVEGPHGGERGAPSGA